MRGSRAKALRKSSEDEHGVQATPNPGRKQGGRGGIFKKRPGPAPVGVPWNARERRWRGLPPLGTEMDQS